MSDAECPECGAEVSLHDDLEVGEIIDCGTCGAELEVIGRPTGSRNGSGTRRGLGRVSLAATTAAAVAFSRHNVTKL
jgi:hypothetical protein